MVSAAFPWMADEKWLCSLHISMGDWNYMKSLNSLPLFIYWKHIYHQPTNKKVSVILSGDRRRWRATHFRTVCACVSKFESGLARPHKSVSVALGSSCWQPRRNCPLIVAVVTHSSTLQPTNSCRSGMSKQKYGQIVRIGRRVSNNFGLSP